MSRKPLVQMAKEIIQGGAKIIQLREKNLADDDFLRLARKLRELTLEKKVLFIINDRVDIAFLSRADGVHLGDNDLSIQDARKILGSEKIIGMSCKTLEKAQKAEKDGANYLGVGAVFSTSTKKDALAIDFEELSIIQDSVLLPLFAIGGIQLTNLKLLQPLGIQRVAVSSAILSSSHPEKATNNFINKLESSLKINL